MSQYIPRPDDVRYIQDTLYVVGGKWKLPILCSLMQGVTRFSEIEEAIPDLTARMLSRELKELELNGFIVKKSVPGKSEYEVTGYCKSFEGIIREMILWGKKHREFLKKR